MSNILTVPASGYLYFDNSVAAGSSIPNLSGQAIQFGHNGLAGLEITSYNTEDLERFSVNGNEGKLFSVSDFLTGDIFSVNDAAGLPIIKVTSDATSDIINIGTFGTNAFVVNDVNVGIGTTTPSEKLEVNGDLMLQQNGVIKNKNNNTQFRFGVNDLYLDAGHLRAGYGVGIRGNRGSTKGMEQGSTLNSDLGIFCGGNEAISIHSDGNTLVNNNLEVGGTTTVGKITLSENSFVIATSSFTISEEHRGATVLLQNPSPMTVTISPQVSGHVTTFIAETSNIVNFASGVGLSGFNSFNSANRIAGQFGQAQVIYKSPEYAFFGGNVV
tara:strand:+ start:666 stop:1649 length:984 start_codon:yes stop_codon:yes gene_type:complete